jgi:hypothetical protein
MSKSTDLITAISHAENYSVTRVSDEIQGRIIYNCAPSDTFTWANPAKTELHARNEHK